MHVACIKVKIKGKESVYVKTVFHGVAFGSLCSVLLGSFMFGSEDAPVTGGGSWPPSESLWLLPWGLALQ